MKRFLTLLLFLTVFAVSAQVSMELEFNRSVYMKHEQVVARLKLRNFSGQPLVFGEDSRLQGELLFEFFSPDNRILPFAGAAPIPVTGMILNPGETKELIIPVSSYYPFLQTGSYRGHAYIRHRMLKNMFKSNDVRVDIDSGVEIWRREAGIPDMLSDRKQGTIDSKSYVLKSLLDGNKRYYYLLIEDNKNIYAIYRIGIDIGNFSYKADVDMLSRLHIILPRSSSILRYCVVNINGEVEIDKYLKVTDTIPGLVRDMTSGAIRVVGGADAVPGVDYEIPVNRKL